MKTTIVFSVALALSLSVRAQSVVSISDADIRLNWGSLHGVSPGMRAYVLKQEKKTFGGGPYQPRQQLPIGVRMALIRVISVTEQEAVARIEETAEGYTVKSDQRLQFIDNLLPLRPSTESSLRPLARKTEKVSPPASTQKSFLKKIWSGKTVVSEMTVTEKLEYARALTKGNRYGEAVRVYDMVEEEVPDTTPFADESRQAKERLRQQEEELALQWAEAKEMKEIRSQIDYYRTLVHEYENRLVHRAIGFQESIVQGTGTPGDQRKLVELRAKVTAAAVANAIGHKEWNKAKDALARFAYVMPQDQRIRDWQSEIDKGGVQALAQNQTPTGRVSDAGSEQGSRQSRRKGRKGAASVREADTQKWVNIGAVNLRKGPGTSHPIVLVLSANDMVRTLGRDGRWLQVEWASNRNEPAQGWMSERFLSDRPLTSQELNGLKSTPRASTEPSPRSAPRRSLLLPRPVNRQVLADVRLV